VQAGGGLTKTLTRLDGERGTAPARGGIGGNLPRRNGRRRHGPQRRSAARPERPAKGRIGALRRSPIGRPACSPEAVTPVGFGGRGKRFNVH
jgi:hypothetical protein